jgi:hypothetical protein
MTKPSKHGSDGWVRLLAIVVPREIRRQFVGELMAERTEMREQGVPPWRIKLRTIGALMVGLVQHAPLVEVDPEEGPTSAAERAGTIGWLLWRASGPILFLGYAFSITALVVLGVLALIGCFACIGAVVVLSHEHYGERAARALNAVLGGLATVLSLMLVAGIVASLLVAVSAALGATGLGAFSMKALAFFSICLCGAICLSGWVPREWEPTRIIRHR